MAEGVVQVPVMGDENERKITREEVKRALNLTKVVTAPGMAGVSAKMLKEGGVTVWKWLFKAFNFVLCCSWSLQTR